jgi:hypothetical protein
MALIVEDGTGKADAESYASVAGATTYLTSYGENVVWDTKTTTEQEVALRKATRWIEAMFTNRWIGERVYQLQALGWPRSNAVDQDDWQIGYDSVPVRVVQATAILATKALSEELLPDTAAGSGPIKSKSVSAGSVSKSVTFAGVAVPYKVYTLAQSLLRPRLQPVGVMERG